MKVVHINTEDGIGGAAIACIRLHRSLLKYGVDSSLLLLNRRDQHIEASHDFREIYLSSFYKRISLFIKSKLFESKKEKILSQYPNYSDPVSLPDSPFDITLHPLYQEADLVHLHWVSGFLDVSSFFKKNKKPVIWTLHDKYPFTGGPHCTYQFPYEQYKNLLSRNQEIMIGSMKGSKLTVVSPSINYKKLSKQSPILNKFPHQTIHHGIDGNIFRHYDSGFSRKFWNLPPNKKIILFAVSEYKRPLKGMSILVEAIRNLDFNDTLLLTIGRGFPSDLGIDSVHLGLIKDERLMALAYSAADVYVSPSLEESFGLSLAEAISCGCPVVTFSVGAAPELIHQGNGIICSEISSQELRIGIETVLQSQYDHDQIAADAQNMFSIEIQTRAYRDLYHQLVNS